MLFALHYAKLFQILLDYASHQKCMPINTVGPGTSACIAEIHIWHSNTVVTVVPVQAKLDHWRRRERKSVASPCNDKVAGFVLSRNSYALIESFAHLDSCARPKKCRPCPPTSNFVVAGHRPVLTDRKTQFRAAYSCESDTGRTVSLSNCFTKSYFIFCQNCWCRVLWHRLLGIAKSCLLWKMPSLC